MPPFFSICIPATGRSRTIERAIKSVIDQDFENVELVITMRRDLLTYEVANSFIKTNTPCFPVKVINIDKDRIYCNDWNDSIKLSSGNFIVVLEGDDYFFNGYLQTSYNLILKYNYDICVFATTNRDKKSKPFQLDKFDFFNLIYNLKSVPAPSESIFPRICNDHLVLYDIDNYNYAPEIDLYLRLSNHINNFVRLSEKFVYREASSDPYNRISKLYYVDHLVVLFKFYQFENTTVFLRGLLSLIDLYFRSLIKYIIWRIRK
ncbi:glycosyltransferase [Pseudarcicella sp. GAP-15]|nr:glycosyltransferase [Pseudarcicella sp. GAP-15]